MKTAETTLGLKREPCSGLTTFFLLVIKTNKYWGEMRLWGGF